MADIYEFKGCPYPIEKHPLGYLHTQWGIDQIKSDLLILLLTNPGERVMLPTFGTPLKTLLFEPNDAIVIQQARQMIADSIRQWEPRVAVQQINVFFGTDGFSQPNESLPATAPTEAGMTGGGFESDAIPENEHVLGIQIKFFDPQNISEINELVLQVPMR